MKNASLLPDLALQSSLPSVAHLGVPCYIFTAFLGSLCFVLGLSPFFFMLFLTAVLLTLFSVRCYSCLASSHPDL